MYSQWINYVYGKISSGVSYTTTSLISLTNVPIFSSSNSEPETEPIMQIASSSHIENIESVIHDYKRINTTYQANKKIIHSDNKYLEELSENITYLSELNKDLKDEYIERWVEILKQRKKVLNDDLNVLNNSQKMFNKFSVKEETHNLDTLTICSVCMENKKDRSIDCGHIFCNECIKKLTNCPTCRTVIEVDKIRQVFI